MTSLDVNADENVALKEVEGGTIQEDQQGPNKTPPVLSREVDKENGDGAITFRLNPDYLRLFDDNDDVEADVAVVAANNEREKYQEVDDHSDVPASVLRYERRMRRLAAADRASAPLDPATHLRVLHVDDDVVVANKPSGVLCVPGVRDNPSLASLVRDRFGRDDDGVDRTVVHRLDMDTSGVVVFARNAVALKTLHGAFRDREVDKTYEALLCGRFPCASGVVDLPLQRDHRFPPFMRVSTPRSEKEAAAVVRDLQHNGWKKMVRKRPKPSVTKYEVIRFENYHGLPTTRVRLTPVTGRTHQLRVHMAAVGHPIVGDPAYGYLGEACPGGGLPISPTPESVALQRQIHERVREQGQCMCLHARRLVLPHPVTGERTVFEAAPDF